MKKVIPALALFAAAALCAHAGAGSSPLKSSTATKTSDDAAKSAMGEYKGVKHALGVMDFTADEGFYCEEMLKDNMRAMLESALGATGRFVIVERGNLDAVLSEQDLQSSGRASAAAGTAQTGKVRSARYLAATTITEASQDTQGNEGGISIKGFRIGGSAAKSAIVIVVKLVDTTTSEVVASERIRGEAGKSGLSLGYSGGNWGGDLGTFAKTPMGEAAQDCINQAVKFIAGRMEAMPVEGSVVAVTGAQIIVNLGENYGISTGRQFAVRKKGEVLTDPETGEILGSSEGESVGTIEVVSVKEKMSTCKLVDGEAPSRGDTVVVK